MLSSLANRWLRGWRRDVLAGIMLAAVAVGGALAAVNNFQLQVGVLIGIFSISALGLTVVTGRAGQLALGQAGFMGVGAYTSAFLTRERGLWLPPAVLVAGVAATLLGVAVGYVALRLRGNYLAMATLAMGTVIFGLLQVRSPLGGTLGFFHIPGLSVGGRDLALTEPIFQFTYVWIAVFICYAGCAVLLRGRFGRELAAVRDDEVAALAVGVPVTSRKVQAFAISAWLGGVAGALLAAFETVIDPNLFRPDLSFQLFLMVVLGGLGSLPGAVIGTAVIEWLMQLVPGTADVALTALGVMVVVFMAVLPDGLAAVPRLVAGGLPTRYLQTLREPRTR